MQQCAPVAHLKKLLLLTLIAPACAPPPCVSPADVHPPGSAERLQHERAEHQACREAGLSVEVLGSGGPIADDARAGSSYLIWIEGRARVMVDAGGGSSLRFGEAGAKFEDLDLIALTHLHADHAAGIPALIKSGYFSERRADLTVYGPTGNERFPDTQAFLGALFDPKVGAFRYLSGYLTGEDDPPYRLMAKSLDAAQQNPTIASDAAGIRLEYVGVTHGEIPAVGYLVTIGDHKIAFGGDQTGDNPAFVAMVHDADLLVTHHPIPEQAQRLRNLHATPAEIGAAAAAAQVKTLVLSHHMARSLADLPQGLEQIKEKYKGDVEVADDHSCYVVAP